MVRNEAVKNTRFGHTAYVPESGVSVTGNKRPPRLLSTRLDASFQSSMTPRLFTAVKIRRFHDWSHPSVMAVSWQDAGRQTNLGAR